MKHKEITRLINMTQHQHILTDPMGKKDNKRAVGKKGRERPQMNDDDDMIEENPKKDVNRKNKKHEVGMSANMDGIIDD